MQHLDLSACQGEQIRRCMWHRAAAALQAVHVFCHLHAAQTALIVVSQGNAPAAVATPCMQVLRAAVTDIRSASLCLCMECPLTCLRAQFRAKCRLWCLHLSSLRLKPVRRTLPVETNRIAHAIQICPTLASTACDFFGLALGMIEAGFGLAIERRTHSHDPAECGGQIATSSVHSNAKLFHQC